MTELASIPDGVEFSTSNSIDSDDPYFFEAFAADNGTNGAFIRMVLREVLPGETHEWNIEFIRPSRHSPTGRLTIDHPTVFDEWTSIVLDSNRFLEEYADDPIEQYDYGVYKPSPTDIFTMHQTDDFKEAVISAAEEARAEYNRHQQPSLSTKARYILSSITG